MSLFLSLPFAFQLVLGASKSASLAFGLPVGAWLLLFASVVPWLALTAYYTQKARRIDAARAAQSEEQR